MKKTKKMFSLLCALCLMMNVLVAGAADEHIDAEEQVLTIVNGRLSNEAMMDAIEGYLDLKKLEPEEFVTLFGDNMARNSVYSDDTEINDFIADATNRYEGFYDFELRLGVEFDSVNIDSYIERIRTGSDDVVVLDVYETTAIEYFAIEGQIEPDIMAYGTKHVMTLELIGGEYQVTSDLFDESYITGVCSQKVMRSTNASEALKLNGVGVIDYSEMSEVITSSTYNVSNAIAYANQWCGISGIYTDIDGVSGGSETGGYNNDKYTPYPGVDCANFVSQCLVAGGLETDDTWEPYTDAWVNAKKLHLYLNGKKYATIPADNGNVFPGNPVYWWRGGLDEHVTTPSGHQMICTGYNSAGTPVVNGHNPNAFRVPITNYMNEGNGLYTAQIVNQNKHVHIWQGYYTDAHNHYRYCKMCRIGLVTETHQVVSGACTVCGFTGPFAADLK